MIASEDLSLSRYSSLERNTDFDSDKKTTSLNQKSTVLIEEIKHKSKKTYIRKNAILRLCSISTARVLLILPYSISLCGMGNFLLWYILVAVLSLVKTAALVDFTLIF